MKLQKRFLAAALGFFLASAVFSAPSEAAPGQSSEENTAPSVEQAVKDSRPAPSRAGAYRPYKGGENAGSSRKGLPPRFSEPEKEKAQWTPERRRQMRNRAKGTYHSPAKEKDGDPTIGIIQSPGKSANGKAPKKGNKAPEINTPSGQRPVNPYAAWQEQHKKDDGRFDKDFRHERRDRTYRVNDPYDTDHTPRIRDEKDRHPRPLPTAKKKSGKMPPPPGEIRNHKPAEK